MRQLLDLRAFWSAHEHFFITENTPLGRSVRGFEQTYFLPHFGLGQARQGALLQMLRAAALNFWQSLQIIHRERPDLLVTTGAAAMFFPVVWARLFGAKIVIIESLARFRTLSTFARGAGWLADIRVVQSIGLRPFWPDARVIDPLRVFHRPVAGKKNLLFVTVGAVLTFDRLVNMVADLKARGLIPEEVLIQCGVGGARPAGIETVETLPLEAIQAVLESADIVVCHGGTGSIITALQNGCRVVAVPRSVHDAEVYDSHQQEIVDAFAERGLISMADTPETLLIALQQARARAPVHATADLSEAVAYLRELVAGWSAAGWASRRRRAPILTKRPAQVAE